MAVHIDIGDDGRVRVSVSGIVLELVDTVVLTAQSGQPPRVSIAFLDTKKMTDHQVRIRYNAILKKFEHLARQCAFVDIISSGDTLPSSVAKVTPPEDVR